MLLCRLGLRMMIIKSRIISTSTVINSITIKFIVEPIHTSLELPSIEDPVIYTFVACAGAAIHSKAES